MNPNFIDIKAWFSYKDHADVQISRLVYGKPLSRKTYENVSRASVYRLIRLAEEQEDNNICLSVYW